MHMQVSEVHERSTGVHAPWSTEVHNAVMILKFHNGRITVQVGRRVAWSTEVHGNDHAGQSVAMLITFDHGFVTLRHVFARELALCRR